MLSDAIGRIICRCELCPVTCVERAYPAQNLKHRRKIEKVLLSAFQNSKAFLNPGGSHTLHTDRALRPSCSRYTRGLEGPGRLTLCGYNTVETAPNYRVIM